MLGYLGFQTFLRARGRGRWIAHQLVFWGVILATLITFPLTFGWLAFFSDTATGPGYTIYLLGFRTVSFDALSLLGWMVFHGLDIAAVLAWPAAAGSCGGASATARSPPASASATTSSP